MAPMRTIEELEHRQEEITARCAEIDTEYAGQALPDDTRSEWNELNEEREQNDELLGELVARRDRVRALAGDPDRVEKPAIAKPSRDARGQDIYDLTRIRQHAGNPDEEVRMLRDAAKRHIEATTFPTSRAKDHAARMLEGSEDFQGDPAVLARHMLVTGNPTYKRAFQKKLAGQVLTNEEARAMSLTGSAGGFAVPFELDPTIIGTSNGSVNPFRAISRVVQITGDEWRGVSSGAITAAYAAEATEATDNSPTLAQPTISTEKAQAFIPFSIEIGMDWNGFQAEMSRLLSEAKDDLEASKFATGSGTNEPQGVITGATTLYTAADTDSVTLNDLLGVEAALPPRYQPNATWVLHQAIAQQLRLFNVSTQSAVWIDNLRQGLGPDGQVQSYASLLGYPAYRSSAMSSALTTGQKIAVLGDFSRYVIVDRIGLNIEVIPHLFGTTANYPTGQRGLYAYWRNSAEVVDVNAFRVLRLA